MTHNNNKHDGLNRTHTDSNGLFNTVKTYLRNDRLGELLVLKGYISCQDLDYALALQKSSAQPLGQILTSHKYVSRFQIQSALTHQFILRMTATLILFLATMSVFGAKKAKADYIADVPAKVALSASQDFMDVAYYPALFGSDEKESNDLKAFTKWTSMFDRFEQQLQTSTAQAVINEWQRELQRYQRLPLKSMAQKVNEFMNEKRYIVDQKNWGKSDYWATPVEFMQRGGDCEDFAIAKYTALRALGVPENRLRVAIVHDNVKNIPHAVLIIYTDQGPYALDNQNENLVNASRMQRYRPIFSINREGWWLHTVSNGTRLASVQ